MNFPTGVSIAREEAFRYFEAVGLPSRRVEAFKYTDLRAALKEAAAPGRAPGRRGREGRGRGAKGFAGVEAVRLTFVNGHLIAEASDLDRVPAGVTITTLNDALTKGDPLLDRLAPVAQTRDNPIYQLNAAFMADGALIRVARAPRSRPRSTSASSARARRRSPPPPASSRCWRRRPR